MPSAMESTCHRPTKGTCCDSTATTAELMPSAMESTCHRPIKGTCCDTTATTAQLMPSVMESTCHRPIKGSKDDGELSSHSPNLYNWKVTLDNDCLLPVVVARGKFSTQSMFSKRQLHHRSVHKTVPVRGCCCCSTQSTINTQFINSSMFDQVWKMRLENASEERRTGQAASTLVSDDFTWP